MRKLFLLLFVCSQFCFSWEALGSERERDFLVRKILKLQVEEKLRQCILEHAFEVKGEGIYPTEKRALKDIPACRKLLEAYEQFAGPQNKLNKEYSEAVAFCNANDPLDDSVLWWLLGGGVVVVGATAGAIVAAPFVLPAATVVGVKVAAVAGIAKVGAAAAAVGTAVVANPLTTVNIASLAITVGQKLFADKDEGVLKQEVKRLKKIKAANWSLVVELITVQRDRAQKMQEALKKKRVIKRS